MRYEENRFSAIAYSHTLSHHADAELSMLTEVKEHISPYSGFKNLVDDMRSFLVSYHGRDEHESMRYNEMLNRAIIGFPEDKERLLALINDQLIKRRIHDVPPPHAQYKTLAEAIFAEVIGLNVLELILNHKDGLEEIQVVGRRIFEVRNGEAKPSQYEFATLQDVERIQQNLLLFNHDTMNVRKKWSEAMMSDGSRITLTGFGFTAEPTITIRFYTLKMFDLQSLCRTEIGTINEQIKNLLLAFIHCYFNLVIIGATNTGKTSLIKAMISEMPAHERIVTIEARHELFLHRDFPQRNIIEYEVDEETDYHSSKQAFKLALRQSPKRIVHAEIRDEDANIYVRACTRGHSGSMTTLHANELEDVPATITDMCMLDHRSMNPLRLTKRITEYVTQIGIHMSIVDGKRKLVRIVEYAFQDHDVKTRTIVQYDRLAKTWLFPQPLSAKAARRIIEYQPDMYESLFAQGLVAAC